MSEVQLENLFSITALAQIAETGLSFPSSDQSSVRRHRHQNYVTQAPAESDLLTGIRDDTQIEILARQGVLQSWIEVDELQQLTLEQLGQDMPEFVDGPMYYARRPEYWSALKREFHTLVCTNDKRYSTLKAKLSAAGSKSQLTLVSTVAVAISAHIGLAAGVLVPFCSLCLIALIKLGKEAFCEMQRLDLSLTAIRDSDDVTASASQQGSPSIQA